MGFTRERRAMELLKAIVDTSQAVQVWARDEQNMSHETYVSFTITNARAIESAREFVESQE